MMDLRSFSRFSKTRCATCVREIGIFTIRARTFRKIAPNEHSVTNMWIYNLSFEWLKIDLLLLNSYKPGACKPASVSQTWILRLISDRKRRTACVEVRPLVSS